MKNNSKKNRNFNRSDYYTIKFRTYEESHMFFVVIIYTLLASVLVYLCYDVISDPYSIFRLDVLLKNHPIVLAPIRLVAFILGLSPVKLLLNMINYIFIGLALYVLSFPFRLYYILRKELFSTVSVINMLLYLLFCILFIIGPKTLLEIYMEYVILNPDYSKSYPHLFQFITPEWLYDYHYRLVQTRTSFLNQTHINYGYLHLKLFFKGVVCLAAFIELVIYSHRKYLHSGQYPLSTIILGHLIRIGRTFLHNLFTKAKKKLKSWFDQYVD